MSEWKEYIGSEEQLKEIMGCKKGFALKSYNGVCATALFGVWPLLGKLELKRYLSVRGTTHYLICNPHPLEDMICQQARTGQPVYVLEPILVSNPTADTDFSIHETYSKKGKFFIRKDGYWLSYDTDKPNWYIPGAQYRLTPFEE